MDVSERTQKLVHVELDVVHGHGLLEFGIVSRSSVDGFRDVFEHEVQVHLILFRFVAIRIEECAKVHYVGVFDNSHDLQFSVLETFILQHLLDRDIIVSFIVGSERALGQLCREDDTEGTIADDFRVGVREFDLISSLAVRSDHFDELAGVVSYVLRRERRRSEGGDTSRGKARM